MLVKDGATQPVLDCGSSLFEKVYVETPLDTDGDGKRDLIAVYIRRPAETQEGLKVPAIYVANPYMMECNEDWYQLCEVDRELGDERGDWRAESDSFLPPPREPQGIADRSDTEEIPLDCITDWYHYFLSRGYAGVFCAGLGTKGSEGFNCAGSKEETAAFAAVINWLCGRAKAYTNREDNIEIKAHWCTGKVAMSGKSYLGTMCIALAASGIEGLETIIPEAAISNWYGYFRQNGVPVSCEGWQGDDIHLLTRYCFSRRLDPEDYDAVKDAYDSHLKRMAELADRDSGNYNVFWKERNYLEQVENIKASVFLVHGLNDWNVKPDQCALLWQELKRCGVPSKMILHQGDHIYIYQQATIDFNGIMHRWLDHWLYGIENNVMADVPEVLVQSNVNQELWMSSEQWPVRGGRMTALKPSLQSWSFLDDLSTTPFQREQNNLKEWRDEALGLLEAEKPYRTAAVLMEPEADVRISGTAVLRCRLAVNADRAILSGALVEVGSQRRLTTELVTVEKDGLILGLSGKTADVVRFALEEEPSAYRVVSRGWMDLRNRSGVERKEPLRPGAWYDVELSMIPQDYTVKAGNKLMVVLYGIDPEYTLRPSASVSFEIEPNSLEVLLPAGSPSRE